MVAGVGFYIYELYFLGFSMQSYGRHIPVLLSEAVAALAINPDGKYLDATYGRGGHACEIIKRLGKDGYLYAIDRDPAAVAQARKKFSEEKRFKVSSMDFADIAELANTEGLIGQLDGMLLDLGVSSPQLDDASRGFSFNKDGPLDMRMDPSSGESAANWLNRVDLKELERVFKEYGEERYAARLARAIVTQREQQEIISTLQLAEIIKKAHPRWERGKHPATRVFQAIRIHVNGELESLKQFLAQTPRLLAKGGRLAVISFHSLEDRMVKRFMRSGFVEKSLPRNFPLTDDKRHLLRPLGRPVYPGENELEHNLRSRSAVLRVAEKWL